MFHGVICVAKTKVSGYYMKKTLCAVFMAAAMIFTSAALEVDEVELQVPGSIDSVQFQNYGGPHAVIDSAEAIVNIGADLGRRVAVDVESPQVVRPEGKYTLIHVVDSSVNEGRDADILVLNENAGVDHIKNLRRIVTGYLQTAYNYSRDDAETVAAFVTIYNAVYRGQIDVFEKRYKAAVVEELDPAKVGLSTNWEDWAGNTQIVIPLNDVTAELSAVDTTTLTDENVVEALRREEDMGVEVRESMTDIKEREAAGATERAQEAQKEAAVQRREGNVEQAARSAQTATEQQQIADRKNSEVRGDRQSIVEDRKVLSGETVEVVDTSHNLTGLFAIDGSRDLYTLITVNGLTGEIVRRSPVKQIKGKSVYIVTNVSVADEGVETLVSELFIAVCGVNDGHSATRLCLIDADKLELQKQSEQILSEDSALISRGDRYYVVLEDGNGHYVAAFDKNLVLQSRSELPVSASTPLYETSQGLLVTDSAGNPRLLDWNALSLIW